MYGETISGVSVIRAFGASSVFLRDMLCLVDIVRGRYQFYEASVSKYYLEYESTILGMGRYVDISYSEIGIFNGA